MLPVRIFGPGIEFPIRYSQFALVAFHEYRAGIACPDAVRAEQKRLDLRQINASEAERPASFLVGAIILHEQAYPFALVQVADDFDIDPRNRPEFPGPIVAVVGPGEPDRLVRLPFGRHAKTQ